jgi:hypothetical protein
MAYNGICTLYNSVKLRSQQFGLEAWWCDSLARKRPAKPLNVEADKGANTARTCQRQHCDESLRAVTSSGGVHWGTSILKDVKDSSRMSRIPQGSQGFLIKDVKDSLKLPFHKVRQFLKVEGRLANSRVPTKRAAQPKAPKENGTAGQPTKKKTGASGTRVTVGAPYFAADKPNVEGTPDADRARPCRAAPTGALPAFRNRSRAITSST